MKRAVQIMVPIILVGCGAALADVPAVTDTAAGLQRGVSGGSLEAVMFYLFAGVTLACGLAICVSRNIVRMAVYLFGTLGAVAVLYFLLLANFIAVVQLIVYAGGTLVLLIFGVMLTSKSPWARFDTTRTEHIVAGLVCTTLAVVLLGAIGTTHWPSPGTQSATPSMATFGQTLLTDYLVPFEVVSVLLLVVMIGAAYLARQE